MIGSMIDVNVHLSRWPTRRVLGDEPKNLVTKLRAQGIMEAWAGSFEGLLHKDIAAVNTRLSEACRRQAGVRLVPFGSINPMLPDWEEDLRRCAEVHQMPGIRLHPNYHGYTLDHPEFVRLLRLAAERRMIVTIALAMEDERMMAPLLRVPPVDPGPLIDLISRIPGARMLLLNALRALRGDRLVELLRAGDVSVEIAMLEGVGGLERLLDEIPLERVCLGSHAPYFYPEAALLKLKESPLSALQRQAVSRGNARRLLPAPG